MSKANKTLRLDPILLEKARKILGYKTYTKTIEDTLRQAVNNQKFWNALKRSRGKFKSFRSLYE